MNSDQIFEYSNNFLKEINEDLIKLRIKKKSDPTNIDFDNKLKQVLGKKFSDDYLNELNSLKDNELKGKIIDTFKISREERIKFLGIEQSKEIEKRIFLQSIDVNWKSHIQYLEQLRQVIGLRSYGQRDPLIEYKKEAFNLFENLLNKLKYDYITILMNLKIIEKAENQKNSNIVDNPKCLLVLKQNEKISRNEKCEATGKKFKNCCGAL